MGAFSGPEIVRNGLLFCLDSTNSKSYPGSGTTWFDLTGNNYNATLVNGVTYNSSTKLMTFDGSNDYATVSIDLRNTTYSVMALARYLPTGNKRRIIAQNSGNWLMGW